MVDRTLPARAIASIAQSLIAMRPRSGDPTQTAVQTLEAVELAMPLTLVCKSWRAAVDSVLYRRVASSSLLGCAHLCRTLWGRSELLEAVRALDISIPVSSVDSFAMLLGGLDGLEVLNVYLSDDDLPPSSVTTPVLQVQPSSSLAGALMGVYRLRRLSFLSSAAFDLNALLSVGGPDLSHVDVSGLAVTTSVISGPPAHIQSLVLREPSPQLAQMLVHLPRGASLEPRRLPLTLTSAPSPPIHAAPRARRRPRHVQLGRRGRASAPRDPSPQRDRSVERSIVPRCAPHHRR